MTGKPTIAIVGAGSLATSLAPALHKAGYTICEIISRNSPRLQQLSQQRSQQRAGRLARSVKASAVTLRTAALHADVLWLCVPDREIRKVAAALAKRARARCAFHSSGALTSGELDALRAIGVAVASVHPLMTFVPKRQPSLKGVPFALEGDTAATSVAKKIVRDLGGHGFSLPAKKKAAYHAWSTMTSPLFLAFLVTLEQTARAAGLTREDARRKSLPIIRQTLENYSRLGPDPSFSGPIIRGDVETVAKHLDALRGQPTARAVYLALAKSALASLPAKNKEALRRLF